MWIRANVISGAHAGEERVFNLDQVLSWHGFGDHVQIDQGGGQVSMIDVPAARMEIVTGSSGHFTKE